MELLDDIYSLFRKFVLLLSTVFFLHTIFRETEADDNLTNINRGLFFHYISNNTDCF